jgi:hypothetical protein
MFSTSAQRDHHGPVGGRRPRLALKRHVGGGRERVRGRRVRHGRRVRRRHERVRQRPLRARRLPARRRARQHLAAAQAARFTQCHTRQVQRAVCGDAPLKADGKGLLGALQSGRWKLPNWLQRRGRKAAAKACVEAGERHMWSAKQGQ